VTRTVDSQDRCAPILPLQFWYRICMAH